MWTIEIVFRDGEYLEIEAENVRLSSDELIVFQPEFANEERAIKLIEVGTVKITCESKEIENGM